MLAKIKLYLIIAGVTLALGVVTNGVTAWKFYGYGHGAATQKCKNEKDAATNKKLNIIEKKNEIRNHEPDIGRTIKRVFARTF